MKLYTRTTGGIGLGLDVLLTGQVKEVDGRLHDVEVSLPFGCDGILQQLPKTPSGRTALWAYANDLCRNDGSFMDHEELLDEIKHVNERNAAEMLRGPLGENWP